MTTTEELETKVREGLSHIGRAGAVDALDTLMYRGRAYKRELESDQILIDSFYAQIRDLDKVLDMRQERIDSLHAEVIELKAEREAGTGMWGNMALADAADQLYRAQAQAENLKDQLEDAVRRVRELEKERDIANEHESEVAKIVKSLVKERDDAALKVAMWGAGVVPVPHPLHEEYEESVAGGVPAQEWDDFE